MGWQWWCQVEGRLWKHLGWWRQVGEIISGFRGRKEVGEIVRWGKVGCWIRLVEVARWWYGGWWLKRQRNITIYVALVLGIALLNNHKNDIKKVIALLNIDNNYIKIVKVKQSYQRYLKTSTFFF